MSTENDPRAKESHKKDGKLKLLDGVSLWPRFSLLEMFGYITAAAIMAKTTSKFGYPALVPAIGIFVVDLNCRGKLLFLQTPRVMMLLIVESWILFSVFLVLPRYAGEGAWEGIVIKGWESVRYLAMNDRKAEKLSLNGFQYPETTREWWNRLFVWETLNLMHFSMLASPLILFLPWLQRLKPAFVSFLGFSNGVMWGAMASRMERDCSCVGYYVLCLSLLFMLTAFRLRRINVFTVFMAMSASMMSAWAT